MAPLTTTMFAISVLGAAPVEPPIAEAQQVPAAQEQRTAVPTGSFEYAGGESEWQAIKEKIAQVTESLLVGELLAREKLEKMLEPSPKLAMKQGSEVFVVKTDRDRIEAPLGGSAKYTSPDGEKFTVYHRARDRKLVQLLENGEGRTRKVFALDGETLKVRVRIDDDRLPKPLAFTMTYRRK